MQSVSLLLQNPERPPDLRRDRRRAKHADSDLSWRLLASPEQSRHGLGLDQLTRLVEVVQDHGGRVDAEGVVDRGEQLAWMNGIRQGAEPVLSDWPWMWPRLMPAPAITAV